MEVKNFTDKYLPAIILLLLCILIITLSLLSEGYTGGADNIYHYYISRFSFKYPHLFLDLWGRPLFTILSAPFSQFGFNGIKIFNILAGLLTCYIAFLLAKKLKLTPSFLVIFFVCFTPLYFSLLFTGLTEILFGLVLILAIYYFFDEKYIISSIVISFLMFARNEGFILLPFFFLAFFLKKKIKAVPFLATGFLLFSVLGSFYYRDFLWILHRFPYSVRNPAFYKSGSLFHYYSLHDKILGAPVEILASLGVLYLIYLFFSKNPTKRHEAFYEALMVLGPFVIYVVFHSVLYWQGLGGSLGLDRVIAGVLPLAAILAMKGYSMINRFLPGIWLKSSTLMLCVCLVILVNFKTSKYPVILDPEEKLEKQSSSWFERSAFAEQKLHFTDFDACFFVHSEKVRDLFNNRQVQQIHFMRDIKSIPPGCIIQWDSHFGTNESGIPRDSLMLNPHLQLLNYFRPEDPFNTLGGNEFEIFFFRRLDQNLKVDNYALMDTIRLNKEQNFSPKLLLKYDFETKSKDVDASNLSRERANSGSQSFRITGRTEFSPVLAMKCSDISDSRKTVPIQAEVYVYLPDSLGTGEVSLVVSLEQQEKSYQYEKLQLNFLNLKLNAWNKITFPVILHKINSGGDVLKVYLWNPGKKELFLDDFSVETLIPIESPLN